MSESASGSADLHVGWLVPGKKLCLGAGPVVLRFTVDEAEDLYASLYALLKQRYSSTADEYTSCGCPPEHVPDSAAPVSFFWADENGS